MQNTATETSVSQKNIHAILQQRRLRHIVGIFVRNLTISHQFSNFEEENENSQNEDHHPELYFTIQTSSNSGDEKLSPVIYESEHVPHCSNPSWYNLEIEKTSLSASNGLFLQLWTTSKNSQNPEAILHWKLSLSRLAYIAEHLHLDDLTFSPNALLLKISGSFYSLPQCFSTESPHGNCPHFNLDEEKVSCNVFSLKRIMTCHKSIRTTRLRTSEFVSSIDSLMTQKELKLEKVKQIEDLQAKIKRLKELLARESQMLKNDRSELMSLNTEVTKRNEVLKRERASLLQERDQHNEVENQLTVYRKRTGIYTAQLNTRRVEVLSELAYIFPIVPYDPPTVGRGSFAKLAQKAMGFPYYAICDIFLPDAESLISKEDAKNAIAMGYVSQMIVMISHFLSIPLTYRLELRGSQSTIVDHITEKLQDKERTFPLFSKNNKDRFLFEYAVYLLNKNIGQVLYQLDRTQRDLRPTLHNLKVLLELGVRRMDSQGLVPPNALSPRQRRARSPGQRRREKEELDEVSVNGMTNPADMVERMHDKSAELNTLRGELFAGTKKAKPIPVSPRRSAATNSTNKQEPVPPPTFLKVPSTGASQNIVLDDISIPAAQNSDSAVLLTGLEDLDKQSPKNSSRKPLDVIAARNELFSTKSGRQVFSKRHTYAMRTSGTSHADNYFSTKEQLFRKSKPHDKAPSVSNGDKDFPEEGDGEKNDTNLDVKAILPNAENNNLKTIPTQAPHAIQEEIDLC